MVDIVFLPHGSYSLSIKGKVIIDISKGAWNEERIKEFVGEFKRLAGSLSDNKWAYLLELSEFEGVDYFDKLISWAARYNCTHIACIKSNLLVRYLNKLIFKNKENAHDFEEFESITDAFDWL